MPTLTQAVTREITWKTIASFCENGKASDLLTVGDIISIVLKNEEKMRIAVAGINTYKENEVIFAFKDILSLETVMNHHYSNLGGYDATNIAEFLDTTIFGLLPDDLQAVIKERRGHKLWLFSYCEVFGRYETYSSPSNDVYIPYYKQPENRIKRRRGTPDWWWLSSPHKFNIARFCAVDDDGHSVDLIANVSAGMAPGFYI